MINIFQSVSPYVYFLVIKHMNKSRSTKLGCIILYYLTEMIGIRHLTLPPAFPSVAIQMGHQSCNR